MRTKTTLAAAAILAAGLVSSMAQANVYSLNIVGYYNVPLGGLTALANSLQTGTPANRADQVIPYSDGDNIQIWTGTSWATWSMDSLSSTGWLNPAGSDAPIANLPILGPGLGFFYGNSTGKTNITFVGDVRTGTNVVAIPVGLSPHGSPLPYGGLVTSPTGINLQVQDGDNIQKWTGTKWDTYSRDSLSGTGWIAPNGSDGPEPTLTVGQGFFYGNSVGAFNWTQILNP
jgi:hypothetical protein